MELQHAAFLLGPSGHAEFRGLAGDDDFAWAGDTAFDLRWSAAETAGARTAVDAYFSAGATRRFVGLMAVDIDFVGGTGVSVFPRGEGLYVAIAPGAQWDAAARMAVAHGLVHRWIGGRLRLRGPAGEGPEAGAWFSAGFARAVARDVLYDLGTLSGRDYADEVNVHESVRATAPLRRASNAEVAAAAAGGDGEAQALATAGRGGRGPASASVRRDSSGIDLDGERARVRVSGTGRRRGLARTGARAGPPRG